MSVRIRTLRWSWSALEDVYEEEDEGSGTLLTVIACGLSLLESMSVGGRVRLKFGRVELPEIPPVIVGDRQSLFSL